MSDPSPPIFPEKDRSVSLALPSAEVRTEKHLVQDPKDGPVERWRVMYGDEQLDRDYTTASWASVFARGVCAGLAWRYLQPCPYQTATNPEMNRYARGRQTTWLRGRAIGAKLLDQRLERSLAAVDPPRSS